MQTPEQVLMPTMGRIRWARPPSLNNPAPNAREVMRPKPQGRAELSGASQEQGSRIPVSAGEGEVGLTQLPPRAVHEVLP